MTNKAQGNMYLWVTGTWNPLAGACPHECSYCSTKSFRWPSLQEKYSGELRIDEKAMTKNLGSGKIWFVCAQNDLFAEDTLIDIIDRVLAHCREWPNNTYVFQTKNPMRYLSVPLENWPQNKLIGATIEHNSGAIP